ncbi:MAG: hypothetical protein NTZ02_00260 [Candidatus Woesearchaeota archaeon]|nr:hypothetical protein [Candidatus Woesearchaeota archaeon]
MDKKFVFIFVSVFLLCAGLARALDFTAALSPITNTANMFEQAKYELSIHNYLTKEDTYILDFISDPTLSITTDPASDYFTGMIVHAEQTKTTTIILKPNIAMTYGAYEIKLNIKSAATGLEQQVRVPVVVTVPDQQQQYAMTMTLAADVPAEVDPRQPMKIIISVENKMPVKRSGLKVVVKDALGLVNQEQNISVDPLGKNVFDINIEFNPIQSPAADTLTISLLTANDELIKRIEKNFDIIAYSPLNESESVRRSFLKTTCKLQRACASAGRDSAACGNIFLPEAADRGKEEGRNHKDKGGRDIRAQGNPECEEYEQQEHSGCEGCGLSPRHRRYRGEFPGRHNKAGQHNQEHRKRHACQVEPRKVRSL